MDSSLIKISFILNLILVTCAIFFAYRLDSVEKVIAHGLQSKHFYFATTEGGRLIRIPPPLNQESLSNDEVTVWVEEALSNLLTLSNENYRSRLKFSSQSFTKGGWESFMKWLQNTASLGFTMGIVAGFDEGVLKGIHVDEVSNLEIVEQGLVAGRYQWILNGTLVLRLNDNKAKAAFRIVIVRSPRLENYHGIGIENISFERAKRYDP